MPTAVGVVGPELVLQKFLTHKEHRYARCCQQETCRDPGSALGVPRACVARISEPGYAGLPVVAVCVQHEIMIFQTVVDLPGDGHVDWSFQPVTYRLEVDDFRGAPGCLVKRSANAVPKVVAVANIEAHAAGGWRYSKPAVLPPVLSD